MRKNYSKSTGKNNYTAIAIIGILFFIFGFIGWLNSLLIPYFKLICELDNFQSMLVAFAFYFSYFLMALPSAFILQKTGFKKGMLLGLWIMAVGTLIFVPASIYRSYAGFLFGLFIQATGLTILQTASNPYVTIMGPLESAAKRISIMGVCNKFAGAIAPLILLQAITKNSNELDQLKQHLHTSTVSERLKILSTLALRLITPYSVMTAVLFALGLFIYYSPLPDVKEQDNEPQQQIALAKNSIFQFPHLWLGVLAIFFAVGVEVLTVDSIIGYSQYYGYSFRQAKYLVTFTLSFMIISYLAGVILIPRHINQRTTLQICGLGGCFLSAAALLIKGSASIWLIMLLGFCNALLWPSIWPLALKGLGRFTKKGAALLIMGIMGGAIIPLVYGYFSDHYSPHYGYWIMVPSYAYILFFSTRGYCWKTSKIERQTSYLRSSEKASM